MYQRTQPEDLFEDLLVASAEASSMGHVILAGDFNARTASLSDELDTADLPDFMDFPVDIHPCSYTAPVRQSLDLKHDTFGSLLLQFCCTSQFYILNGRIPGDVPAQFTSHANGGHSCIDYFIASPGLCNSAVNLKVHDIIATSDHFPVVLTLDLLTTSAAKGYVSTCPVYWNDPARTELFQAAIADTDVGVHPDAFENLSAEAGFQVLQTPS